MAPCDLCGKDSPLVTIRIEGAELAVCSGCGKHGTVISRPAAIRRLSPSFSVVEKEERVIADYAEKIRAARQRAARLSMVGKDERCLCESSGGEVVEGFHSHQ